MALSLEQLAQELRQLLAAFQASQLSLEEARQGLLLQQQAANELQRQPMSTDDALVGTRGILEELEATRTREVTGGASLIYTKGICKPATFTCEEPRKFPDWAFKFTNCVADRYVGAELALGWAKMQDK